MDRRLSFSHFEKAKRQSLLSEAWVCRQRVKQGGGRGSIGEFRTMTRMACRMADSLKVGMEAGLDHLLEVGLMGLVALGMASLEDSGGLAAVAAGTFQGLGIGGFG